MNDLLYQVLECKTYNISNHVIFENTSRLTSNIWSALNNMMLRTKNHKYIYRCEDGHYWVHIPQKFILSAVRCSLRTVQRAVTILKELGLLAIKRIRTHASNRNYYRIPTELVKNLLPGDPCKNAPDKDIDMRHSDVMHSGNYILNTNKKNDDDVTVQTITSPTKEVETIQQQMTEVSWKNIIFNDPDVKSASDRAITEPLEASTAQSMEVPWETMRRGRDGLLGGFIRKITGFSIAGVKNASQKNPITLRKQQIDRSTLAGSLKRIYKHILDVKGLDGLRFMTSYLDNDRIKIEYNKITNEHNCVIEDDCTRSIIEKLYGSLFSTIGVTIVG